MSYTVLARKWRPQNFEDVVGQEHITRTLRKAIEMDRVAHAYIFSGTRGIGKTTIARILVRALNCEKGPTPNPCNECASCKNILAGNSLDVLEIDGASNNRVEDIRELRDNVGYSSMGGTYRIFIIDEVHMLTKQAFNALLKTLEEPPKNVIFIFATTEPNKIPETIHSRCQRYDFRRITTEQILSRLVYICDIEKIPYERNGLLLVSRKADGSMRDALSLLDQVYSFCPDNIVEAEVRRVLGLVDMEVYRRMIDAVADKNPAPLLDAVEQILFEGNDLQDFLTGLEEHLRMLLFARMEGVLDNKRLGLYVDSPEIRALLGTQADRFDEGILLRMIEIARKAENDLRWSSFPRFLVEITLLKLMHLDSTVSLEQVLAAVKSGDTGLPRAATANSPVVLAPGDALKKKIDPVVLPPRAAEPPALQATTNRSSLPQFSAAFLGESDLAVAKEPTASEAPPWTVPGSSTPSTMQTAEAAPIAPPAPTIALQELAPTPAPTVPISAQKVSTDVASFTTDAALDSIDWSVSWPQFVESLMQDNPKLGSFLALSYIAASSDQTIDLRFGSTYRFQFTDVSRKENRDYLSAALNRFSKRTIALHISIETSLTGSSMKVAPVFTEEKKHSIEDDAEKEPIINTLLELFDGEVIQ